MEWLFSLGPVFVAGVFAGLTVAMPFGPFGQLAARLTTEKKRRAARELAYTAVAVDAGLSALVLGFLYAVPLPLSLNHPWAMGAVGVIVVIMGVEIWMTAHDCPPGHLPGGFKKPWQFAAVYSLLQPGSLLIFMAAFGVLHANGVFDNAAMPWGARLVCWLGVVCGMFAMWAIWFSFIHHLKRRMEHGFLRIIFARGFAVALGVSGVVLLWKSGLIQILAG